MPKLEKCEMFIHENNLDDRDAKRLKHLVRCNHVAWSRKYNFFLKWEYSGERIVTALDKDHQIFTYFGYLIRVFNPNLNFDFTSLPTGHSDGRAW